MKLGKLKEVELRSLWAHEQYDFSKWLAQEENIKELNDTLGLSITEMETEQSIGSYRSDIVGKDELTNNIILIENQLEQTDHDHLGKIITYASGIDASIVIWIVASAREEHASAIEWLNKHTDDSISFFLLEIHAYKIGDSMPAPMFKIIEQPNGFMKNAKTSMKQGVTEAQSKRLEFWTRFNDVVERRGKPFNKRKPSTDHWYNVAIGSSQCHISIDLVNKEHKIRVSIWIPDNKEMFDSFEAHKAEIEAAVGEKLNWDRMDRKKASIISLDIRGLNFNKQDNYDDLMNEVIDKAVAMREAFAPYLNDDQGM